jgi:RNase P subunit RPR2
MRAHSPQGMTVTVMHSSGQVADEFVAPWDCERCGIIDRQDIWRDPEMNPDHGFTCKSCGQVNRFEMDTTDPDKDRDCDD